MAKKPTQEAPASAYDAEQRYEVKLAKPVVRKGRVLSPLARHVMTGRVLAELPPDAVAEAKPG